MGRGLPRPRRGAREAPTRGEAWPTLADVFDNTAVGAGADYVEVYRFDPSPSRYSFPAWLLARLMEDACIDYGLLRMCRKGRKVLISNHVKRYNGTIDEFVSREAYWYTFKPFMDSPRPLEARSAESYTRLHGPVPGSPPTLLINGVVMHRVSRDWDPWRDAESKVRRLHVRPGHLVLDTCAGLGYTAIAAARRGARVVTVEKSRDVLILAEHNPFSSSLYAENVSVLLGDVAAYIRLFKDSLFDRVLHDPPRYSMAGELYSRDFYAELYRVLKPGGLLLHYTGEPQRSRGRGHGPIVRGVMERLRAVGFRVRGYDEKTLSVLAVKPGGRHWR